MTEPVPMPPSLARRRKLLMTVPFAVASLQGCGGGASAAPAPSPAPAPAPAPAPNSGVTTVGGWSARPAAAASAGPTIFVPDVGSTGSLWFSNGTAWIPLSNPLTLAHRFSNASMDASVGARVDVLLDSVVLPAYVLGANSSLRITAAYSFPGGGTSGKAPQVRAWFSGATYAANGVALLDTRGQLAAQRSVLLEVTLQNRNAMASNETRPIDYTAGASGNAPAVTAIDFTQDVTIGFGALNDSTSTSAADRQVLDWFSIEMLA